MKYSLFVALCAVGTLVAATHACAAEGSGVPQVYYDGNHSPTEVERPVTQHLDPCPCVCPVSVVRETVWLVPRCEYRPRWSGNMDVQRDQPDASHSWGSWW